MASHEEVEILPLRGLSRQELDEVNQGYTSPARYEVRKVETLEHTSITLHLQPLDQPYIKQFHSADEELERYQEVAVMGYSLGAYAGERLVGLALSEPRFWNRSLWVWEFHIAPAFRRQGLGRRLMDALAELAQGRGFRVLVCETQNYNVPAIRFYRAVGFEMDGIDLSYYTNTDALDGEVAIFMKRRL